MVERLQYFEDRTEYMLWEYADRVHEFPDSVVYEDQLCMWLDEALWYWLAVDEDGDV